MEEEKNGGRGWEAGADVYGVGDKESDGRGGGTNSCAAAVMQVVVRWHSQQTAKLTVGPDAAASPTARDTNNPVQLLPTENVAYFLRDFTALITPRVPGRQNNIAVRHLVGNKVHRDNPLAT